MENNNGYYQCDRRRLKNAVMIRLSLFVIIMGLLLFAPAGSIRYWQAWVYLGILFIPMIGVCAYFLKKSPELLERRLRMKEKEKSQKLIIKISFAIFIIAWILPGLDHRFDWSSMPLLLVIIADGMVFTGYMFCFFVLKENEYASRIIEVEKGQRVISTGPYAVIRHPMYLGVLMMYLFSPLALGSWWALLAVLPLPALLVFRILNEERLLERELDGYAGYMQKVKYRLIPFVW